MILHEARPPAYNIHAQQSLPLDDVSHSRPRHQLFPPTRYAGSKLKLLDWIRTSLTRLEFDSALDLFGGTGCVSYLMKTMQKQVTLNDQLRSNVLIAQALIQNSSTLLDEDEAKVLFRKNDRFEYNSFIEETFDNIFFLSSENRWLDIVAQNIARMANPEKQAIAYFALFQAALAKRPYNLFHRANLYMRTANVRRSFGNKVTWDRPFNDHFLNSVRQANRAIFTNGRANRALCRDALAVEGEFDLVYIDPPYMNSRGVSVDYLDFYHFLEGLSEYNQWPQKLAKGYKHKPYERQASPWLHRDLIHRAFEEVFTRFARSILVVSYRSDGIPTPQELTRALERHKRHVSTIAYGTYKYVLSPATSKELLFIAD